MKKNWMKVENSMELFGFHYSIL